ncbi:hypothetical protein EJ02DRAFT_460293 [Clathrospora elynae]|uniref:Uncharacterized protein n=1 Tax=Clathrospora elynae TaxID=706981 RepID=A0A6A5S622_9PLEO|nr:hypothetical protein EJ02DRAFT_460293 [Clathrospora elynae]
MKFNILALTTTLALLTTPSLAKDASGHCIIVRGTAGRGVRPKLPECRRCLHQAVLTEACYDCSWACLKHTGPEQRQCIVCMHEKGGC